MTKRKTSQIRKELNRLFTERAGLEKIMREQGPMVAACFIRRRFAPKRKEACYLSVSVNGVSRHRYVPLKQADYWERRAESWRRYRRAMSQWVKVNQRIEKNFRKLAQLKCEPVPAAKQNGRTVVRRVGQNR